jgi:small subunit ribosomal protein S4e
MVRGPKKHMKRLNAPRHWMLDKLGGVFAPKPAAGAPLIAAPRKP